MTAQPHLSDVVVNINAPGVILVQVGELQAVGVTNLVGFKGGIQILDGDHILRTFGLLCREEL